MCFGGGPKPPDTRPAAEAQRYSADLQYKASQEALALLREQHAQGRADIMPWREAGLQALQQLNQVRDAGGHIYKPWKAPTAEDLQTDPGYQFRTQQGERAIRRNLNAVGGQSGATLKALQQFGQESASQEYQAAYGRALTDYEVNRDRAVGRYNRLASMAGTGQVAGSELATRGAAFAQQAGANIRYGASALGAGEVGAQNAILSGQMAQYRHALNRRGAIGGALGAIGGAAIGGYFGGWGGAAVGGGIGERVADVFAYF